MTIELREKMVAMRSKGTSYREIARRFGLDHPNQVRHHIIQHLKGIEPVCVNKGLPIVRIAKVSKSDQITSLLDLYDYNKITREELETNLLALIVRKGTQ